MKTTDEIREAARLEERARCLAIVESEPELPGTPTETELALMEAAGPVLNARSAVRATKKAIADRIRQSS